MRPLWRGGSVTRLVRLLRRPGAGWLIASLALALAAASTLGGGGAAPTSTIVIARQDIPAGARLSSESIKSLLEVVEVPRSPVFDAVLSSPGEAVDEVVAVGLALGEPLTAGALEGRSDVGPRPLRRGERAISLAVAEPGPGVRPGARVDVVRSSTDRGISARVVVSAAELLSVSEEAPFSGARTVSLRVRVADALEIASASGLGSELRLLLRAHGDTSGVEARP
jgi:Flp pilus assembly protein CpaB